MATYPRKLILAGLLLVVGRGCEAPHDSIDAMLTRQHEALAKLPAENRSDATLSAALPEEMNGKQAIEPGLLTLERAREITLLANPDIHSARAHLESSLAQITEARSFYFPELSIAQKSHRVMQSPNRVTRLPSPYYSYPMDTALPILAEDPSLIDLYKLVRGPLMARSRRITTGETNSYSDHTTAMSASWTLFDNFVREARLMSTKHGYRASAMTLVNVERLLTHAVDTAYYQVQLGIEHLRIARADEQFSREQWEDARKRYDAQKITKAGVLNFEVRLRAAQANVIAARGLIDTGRVVLAELMGLPGARLPDDAEIADLQPETEQELSVPDVEQWIERAVPARPDLAAAEYTLKARAESINLAKRQFGPDLKLSGTWGFERMNTLAYTSEDQSSAVGLEFRWVITTGGFRTAQLRKARAQWWEAAAVVQKKRLEIAAQVRRAVVDLANAQEEVKLQQLNLVAAEENRRVVRAEYTSGKTSLVRLNEAHRDYVQTEADLAEARIRLRQAWSDLYAAGAYRPDLAATHPAPAD